MKLKWYQHYTFHKLYSLCVRKLHIALLTNWIKIIGYTHLNISLFTVLTPRLSKIKSLSTVTIAESNDPYGILSLTATPEEVSEGVKSVNLTVVRSGIVQNLFVCLFACLLFCFCFCSFLV